MSSGVRALTGFPAVSRMDSRTSGMSILNGVQHIAAPHPAAHVGWSYAVLAAAMLFEGGRRSVW